MKNCDTCIYFVKVKSWRDGRKGLCECYDHSVSQLKGKNCIGYRPKKYKR